MKESLTAETVMITGHGDDEIEAYLAKPEDAETFAGVVVIHHMPGYDSSTKEIARKFAAHGYVAIMPNLYWRDAPGASPDDAAAAARAKGGVPARGQVGKEKYGGSKQGTEERRFPVPAPWSRRQAL